MDSLLLLEKRMGQSEFWSFFKTRIMHTDRAWLYALRTVKTTTRIIKRKDYYWSRVFFSLSRWSLSSHDGPCIAVKGCPSVATMMVAILPKTAPILAETVFLLTQTVHVLPKKAIILTKTAFWSGKSQSLSCQRRSALWQRQFLCW